MSTLNTERLSIGLVQALSPWFTGCEQTALVQAMTLTGKEALLGVDSDFAALQAQFTNLYSNAGAGAIGTASGDSVEESLALLIGRAVSVLEYGALGDGVTNDSAAFNAALATGKPVFAPSPKTYRVDDVIVPAGQQLFGDGPLTILQPFTVASSYVIRLVGNDAEVFGLNIQAPKATYPDKVLIQSSGDYNYVHDCTLTGGGTPFFGSSNKYSTAERLTISGYNYNGATFDGVGTEGCKILNCIIDGAGSTVGHCTQVLNGKDCVIDSNLVENAWIFGCFLGDCVDSVITNNIARNTRLEAFQMADSNRCQIIDNVCSWDVGIGQDFGISLWAPSTLPCNYNVIANNRIYNCFKAGISLEGSAGGENAYTKITGNYIYNPVQGSEPFWGAITLYGAGVKFTQITDNYIVSTDAKTPNGVRESLSTDTVIRDNFIYGVTSSPLLKSASSIAAMNGDNLSSLGTSWTPVVTSEAGTITTVGTVIGKSYESEKMVFVACSVGITTIGTATGSIKVTLPFPPTGAPIVMSGWEVNTGVSLRVLCDGVSGVTLRKYDGTAINLNNTTFQFSGWYERV